MGRIESELLNLNKSFTNDKGEYLYFYGVKIDGRYCLKPGITHQKLPVRIRQYFYREHQDQDFDEDSFRILSVYKFKKRKVSIKMESLIKEGFKEYPFNEGQHHSTEQYEFASSWEQFKEYAKTKIPFCEDHWYRKDIGLVVSNILNDNTKNIKTKKRSKKKIKSRMKGGNMLEKFMEMSREELLGVDGIGTETVKKLMNENNRSKLRCFEDIMNKIRGIGSSKLEQLREHLKNHM